MLNFRFSLTFRNKHLPETVILAAGVINHGVVTGIKGPSGSGKTSLLRVLAGLQNPDEGFIKNGAEIWYDSSRKMYVPVRKRRIALVFQDYALFPHMTVLKNILYGATDEIFALYCLEMLRLQKECYKYPFQLSGGQQQRLAIGRALAAQPELLLMDEPFSALDEELNLQLRMEIGELFKRMKQTVLIVSHATDELQSFCSKVLTMKTLEENYFYHTKTAYSGKKLPFADKQGIPESPVSIKIQSRGVRFVG